MNDFAIRAGTSNIHGVITREPNEIAPGKRPLSSMAPAFVEDAKGVLVIGTAGGSRIISQILLAILDFAHGLNVHRIVAGSCYHHQYLPDHVDVEPESFSEEWQHALARKGHTLRAGARRWAICRQFMSIERGESRLPRIHAADPRSDSEQKVRVPAHVSFDTCFGGLRSRSLAGDPRDHPPATPAAVTSRSNRG